MAFLGIPSAGVWLAYVGIILSALLCVVYGIVNWNKGGDISSEEEAEEKAWGEEEKKIESELTDGGS